MFTFLNYSVRRCGKAVLGIDVRRYQPFPNLNILLEDHDGKSRAESQALTLFDILS